jgi:signal transduction histidine kinase
MNKNSDSGVNREYLKMLSKEKIISDEIINNSRSMISIINRNYIYEKVNDTFCSAHKSVVESIIGKSLSDVWGEETFQKTIKSNFDLCLTGKTVRYEASFDTPHHGKNHFEVVFKPISIDNDKEVTHLIVETFDINDLVKTKQAILEKEEEFRKFETNLPIGFIRCDSTGKILHANKALLNILECHDEVSIANMNIKTFYTAEGFFDMQLAQLLDTKTKSFGLVLFKNCSGTEIPCRISGFLAVDDSGNPSFIDFAVEDSSRELMLENRLLQAQKLETIGALAGGIAHDFNNILATISGYSEMLIEDLPKSSDMADKVAKIQAAVLKARSITNQILTFSRQVEQDKIHISVSEVLKETIGFVRSAIPHNISVKSKFTSRDAIVYADPTQLFRVFLNLMTNAIQSMENSGGVLSVTLEIVDGKEVQHELSKDIVADEYVLVSFRDTGKGMDQSLMRRVFEPFFTTREVGKGTGLGLSVVHGIVTEMEGEVLVSSKLEKGSVFYVYLPVSKVYPDFSGNPAKRKKILFIKGNKYESRVFSLALESSGYDLVYASDQARLIEMLSDGLGSPDLIIFMSESRQIKPEDLLTIFKRLNLKTPCILITDPFKEILEEKLLNSGFIMQHLIKPVSLKDIKNAIEISLK